MAAFFYLMTISDFNINLKKLSLINSGMEALAKTDDNMRNLQETQLVFTGKGSDGKTLKRYRNQDYAVYKHGLNPYPGLGVPDLKLTGAFLRNLKVVILTNRQYEIISTDAKYQDLLDKYGDTMLGLNKVSIVQYKEQYFNEALVKILKQKLGLNG